eukprot:273636-Chlamydomonas_euryale.AAC.7
MRREAPGARLLIQPCHTGNALPCHAAHAGGMVSIVMCCILCNPWRASRPVLGTCHLLRFAPPMLGVTMALVTTAK